MPAKQSFVLYSAGVYSGENLAKVIALNEQASAVLKETEESVMRINRETRIEQWKRELSIEGNEGADTP